MKACTYLLLMLFASSLLAQNSKTEPVTPKKMEWFEDAKLGIFIH